MTVTPLGTYYDYTRKYSDETISLSGEYSLRPLEIFCRPLRYRVNYLILFILIQFGVLIIYKADTFTELAYFYIRYFYLCTHYHFFF